MLSSNRAKDQGKVPCQPSSQPKAKSLRSEVRVLNRGHPGNTPTLTLADEPAAADELRGGGLPYPGVHPGPALCPE